MKQNFKTLGFVLLGLLITLFASCKSRYYEDGDIISLNVNWEYCLENPFENSDAVFEILPAKQIDNLQELVDNQYGSIWLRRKFEIPAGLKGKALSAYLGRITLADKTYLNGTLIGSEGHFPPYEFSAWNTSRCYEIPDTIVNEYGENELVIEIFVDGEGSVVSSPYIGETNQVRYSYKKERFWNSQINALFAFLMIVIGLYHLLLWVKSRKEYENLYFCIINIVTALYMSVFYLSEIPGLPTGYFPFLWYQKIFSSALPFFLPYIIQEFVNTFLRRRDNRTVILIRACFVVIPIVAILFAPNYIQLRAMRTWTNPLLLPPIGYIVFTLGVACIKRKKDSIPLLLGFSPLLIASLLDILLHDVFGFYSLPYFSSIGWQLVIIALLFVLANRFSTARKEAEYLNIHLKDEVDKQTKELTASNASLTEANEKLEQARLVAEKDMKLAVNVQQSFYPRRAPKLDDWEIAFKFQPMSGVSGDLYDFFYTGKKLDGIALFDVSGHGIGSGLVTMLSKTVISRCFTNDPSVNINSLMKKINEGIVDDKGDIENYLTGLLVRVDGEKVQYVNAGHPAVFFRSAKTKTCATVEVKRPEGAGGAGQGAVIGIPGMDLDVKGIQFSMQKGDALIMYTDCLSEARNKNGDEFGQESVSKVFAASGDGDAQSKLDYVLKKFATFTAGVDLKDDLTVIVLQKK